ncbi:hypothetical protein NQ317_017436 [Molorchus minor]|uniref:Uncharacterized protein n=1 Tax=Molorchus minor TaxID=1323400 RepID=A0ABQ9J9X0_9CUCU|nr:hypothetical protein NQ317_017436 [Molorchus minor]
MWHIALLPQALQILFIKSIMMAQAFKGDLFTAPDDYSLAHCVSKDFKMEKGIAKEFKNKFGGVDQLRNQGKEVGEVARLGLNGRNIYYLCHGPEPFLSIPRRQVTVALNEWAESTLGEHWRLSRGVEDNPNCPGCGEAEETAFHFLGQCEAFGRLRFVIFGSVTLRREEGGKKGPYVAYLPGTANPKTYYYLVTKNRYYEKPSYENMWNALRNLRRECDENEEKVLALPQTGGGLDKL